MHLGEALQLTAELSPSDFSVFAKHMPREWVLEALEATGAATVRRRRMPVEHVVWLVVAMALMRNESILAIVDRLQLALPSPDGKPIAPSAISQARKRLGEEPLESLFRMLSDAWTRPASEENRWHGLSVWLMDGTKLNVQDTPENRAEFGKIKTGYGTSAFPMLRMVALMEARTHLIDSVSFGPIADHERHLADELWPEIPERSVTIVDNGLFAVHRMRAMEAKNQHWVTRARSNLRSTVVERLGPGDDLVEVRLDPAARRQDPTLPKTHVVRRIRVEVRGFRTMYVLTSLRDAKRYPAEEVSQLYLDRWEIEMSYDDLKTELLESSVTLRSLSPAFVRQELWGILIAYNLVRVEMVRVGAKAGVPANRLSFVVVLRTIRIECDFWAILRTPGTLPERLIRLRADLATRALLPPRRSRSYPRMVKSRGNSYPAKRSTPTAATRKRPK